MIMILLTVTIINEQYKADYLGEVITVPTLSENIPNIKAFNLFLDVYSFFKAAKMDYLRFDGHLYTLN